MCITNLCTLAIFSKATDFFQRKRRKLGGGGLVFRFEDCFAVKIDWYTSMWRTQLDSMTVHLFIRTELGVSGPSHQQVAVCGKAVIYSSAPSVPSLRCVVHLGYRFCIIKKSITSTTHSTKLILLWYTGFSQIQCLCCSKDQGILVCWICHRILLDFLTPGTLQLALAWSDYPSVIYPALISR
jgi:hypothetical protein